MQKSELPSKEKEAYLEHNQKLIRQM